MIVAVIILKVMAMIVMMVMLVIVISNDDGDDVDDSHVIVQHLSDLLRVGKCWSASELRRPPSRRQSTDELTPRLVSSSNSLLTTICLIVSSYADLICIILSICHRHCMFFFGRCTVHWTNFGFPLKECVAYSPAAVIALSVYCMCEVDCQWSGCM